MRAPPRISAPAPSFSAFAVALAPNAAPWPEGGADLTTLLALKRRRLAATPEAVFQAAPGSTAAQAEAAAALADALGAAPARAAADTPPLLAAALTVAEDLLILERRAEEPAFRLTAGALFFPTNWALADKMGCAMADIHGPVPGFGPGSRNAAVIDRVLTSLRPDQPLARRGWSIAPDAAPAQPPGRRAAEDLTADPHLRVERQTLRRLPATGAVLFSVRVHSAPLGALERLPPDLRPTPTSLERALAALTPAEAAYKHIDLARAILRSRLARADMDGGEDPDR